MGSQTTLSGRGARLFEDKLYYAVDNQRTVGLNLQGYPILGLLVPVINVGTVTVEISVDGGDNWYPLKDADGSNAAISISGGAAAFFVSSDVFTPLAGYVGESGSEVLVRLVTGATQDADRTFTWIGVA